MRIYLVGALVIVLALTIGIYLMISSNSQYLITVGIPGKWGTIDPALQHNAYGDSIFTNIFEPLTKTSEGRQLPRLASSWEVSEDFRIFRFSIAPDHFFSDGTLVTSFDIKKSWEDGLKRTPISANSSAMDVLGQLKGFQNFSNSGLLDGASTPNSKTLVLEFAHPFRNALDELSASRVAVSKFTSSGLIGSGPYRIASSSELELKLEPNPFYRATHIPSVLVQYVSPTEITNSLIQGKIDLALFAESAVGLIDRLGNMPEKISGVVGPENAHFRIAINSLSGRFFHSAVRRRALQALVLEKFRDNVPASTAKLLKIDPQSYFRIQQGRILDEEANRIIEAGRSGIQNLIDDSKKSPLYVVSVIGEGWMINYLKSLGLGIQELSRELPSDERLKMYYKTFEPDLFVGSFGISQGDPDGLSHVLHKTGAIYSPITANEETSPLLDAGRLLLERNKIDLHYQNVSRAILREVPYVHLGYDRTVVAFRQDRVRLPMKYRGNDEFSLLEFVDSQ